MITDENHKVYMEKERLKTTGLYSPCHPSQGQNVVNLGTVLHFTTKSLYFNGASVTAVLSSRTQTYIHLWFCTVIRVHVRH